MAKRGRPKFIPTEEQRAIVQRMCIANMTHEQMAEVIGVSKSTLQVAFSELLVSGKNRVTAQVVGALVKAALSGNVGAQCFYLKCQAGWKETSRVEIDGKLSMLETIRQAMSE